MTWSGWVQARSGTPARVLVGRAGPGYRTATQLELRSNERMCAFRSLTTSALYNRLGEPMGSAGVCNGIYHTDADGIHRPIPPVAHRDDEYDSAGFPSLLRMQARHFWYWGRHRFLWHSVRTWTNSIGKPVDAIDLGGGCGGWVNFLAGRGPGWLRNSPWVIRPSLPFN